MFKSKIASSIIDLDKLSDNLSIDHYFIYELLNDYQKDLQHELNRIKLLFHDGNFEDILMSVKSLKGIPGYLDLQSIWQAINLLEKALRKKDLKQIENYYDILYDEHKHLVEYLDTTLV